MDGQNRPGRKVKVNENSQGVAKRGETVNTGPVNNMGNYEDRKAQQAAQSQQSSQSQPNKPVQPARPAQQNPTQPGQTSSQNRQSGSDQDRGIGLGTLLGALGSMSQTSHSGSHQSTGSGQSSSAGHSAAGSGHQQSSSSGGGLFSGGSSKLLLIIILIVLAIFVLPKLFGNDGTNIGGNSGDQGGGLTNLLSAFMGSSQSSVYDFNSGSSQDQYYASTNKTQPGKTLSKYKKKYTTIIGNKEDKVAIWIYMCGTDLESQSGMATADLKEMLNAKIGSNIDLLIYTGGCKQWRNNVIDQDRQQVHQIYQIKNGELVRLVDNTGYRSMTDTSTLQYFIKYADEHTDANRKCLIFWDHGGGSVTGYGYDEVSGRGTSMTLADINKVLNNSGIKFDFIGFDACLMATLENGLMLSNYADYMIASEETEPGVGWYYTNWLTKLSENPSMETTQIGKIIADDFVEVCEKSCRGQGTTLSVVDLAELKGEVPQDLISFSQETTQSMKKKNFKAISKARNDTREFARTSKIDQIDLVDFANKVKTDKSKKLASSLQSAVKYNRTGGGISNAYGLSVYFPYQKAGNVKKIVPTYNDIGMEPEYTRCIQEFANLEISGQLSAGTSTSSYGSTIPTMPQLGGSQGSGYYGSDLASMLGGLMGSDSGTSGIFELLTGRNLSDEDCDEYAEYISNNYFDFSLLQWKNGQIDLPASQWDLINTVSVNVLYNDGEGGYIDMGRDTVIDYRKGNPLPQTFSGLWVNVDGYCVPYYLMEYAEDETGYVQTGYIPAMLNGQRVNVLVCFQAEFGQTEESFIMGAQAAYTDGSAVTEAKNIIGIGPGDTLQFVCDYYDQNQKYIHTDTLGDPITLTENSTIEYGSLGGNYGYIVSYCFTDIYQNEFWAPAIYIQSAQTE